jgi:uncharacterized protein YjbI with pentapeptide repeats
LRASTLIRANVSRANITTADFRDADALGANLTGLDFAKARALTEGMNLTKIFIDW